MSSGKWKVEKVEITEEELRAQFRECCVLFYANFPDADAIMDELMDQAHALVLKGSDGVSH